MTSTTALATALLLPALTRPSFAPRSARDSWAFLNLMLMRRECAEAVLVDMQHAEETAITLDKLMASMEQHADQHRNLGRDPNLTITASMYVF